MSAFEFSTKLENKEVLRITWIPKNVYLKDCCEVEMALIIFTITFKVLLDTSVTRKTTKEAKNPAAKYV